MHRSELLELAAAREPWIDSALFEALLERGRLDAATAERARRYRDDGYLVLEGALPPDAVDRAEEETRAFFSDPQTHGGESHDELRVQDAWRSNPGIRALATAEPILDLLRTLYRREPIPFQTLNFRSGSQQSPHWDAIHFSCLPAGFMCGVWIALEDVDADNGPLVYYPGSQRLPPVDMYDLRRAVDGEFDPNYLHYESFVRASLAEAGLEARELHVPRGSALVWAADLMHGGHAIRDRTRTRFSQVTHYYFDDCVYYTPMYSHRELGEYRLRDIVDIRTGRPVPHRWNGEPIGTRELEQGRVALRAPSREGSGA